MSVCVRLETRAPQTTSNLANLDVGIMANSRLLAHAEACSTQQNQVYIYAPRRQIKPAIKHLYHACMYEFPTLLQFEDLRIDIRSMPVTPGISHSANLLSTPPPSSASASSTGLSLSFGPSAQLASCLKILEQAHRPMMHDGPFFVPRLHPSQGIRPVELGRLARHSG
ncbi:hypothetical protein EW146_g3087 [Bondarzewia mesenterica]|uniref:Uncharacterized protein n=1 Tax=Bondarzewia mesenterica TaxID=1095465 RepID=A0A4S4LYQ3_9AGAM|nr:hypothetical protein EW146_g3087 [Bondarzewia mesenterica]